MTVVDRPYALSMEEARRTLGGISQGTLRRLIAEGSIRTVKLGRRRVVVTASIEELLASRIEA